MPFSILSQGVETQMPTGVTFATVPVFDGAVQIEQMPAVDASGGSLQVVDFQSRGVIDIVYTAADGTTVEQTLTLGGYVSGDSYDTAPVAYGENLDAFLLTAGRVAQVNQGGIDYFSFQEAYVLAPTNSGFEATEITVGRNLTTSEGADTNTVLTPLGDGRVGWVAEDENGAEFQSGIIAEVDGVDIVVRLYEDTVLATEDGGVVGIRQTDTGDFRVQQYNADYQLLESEVLARADLLAQSGLDTQDPTFTFFVNDAGELDVYLSDPADPESTIYKFEFDLVAFDPDLTTATEFSDQLILTNGDDVIDISLGDDTVFGLAGDDLITEVEMRPSNSFSTDRDVIYGGAGDDTILLDMGRDRIYGGDGNDYLDGGDAGQEGSGQSFGNTLLGDAGDDILHGGDRRDRLYGGEDDDTLFGGDGEDTLDGGAGDDKLVGGQHHDLIIGGSGADLLRGSAGNDSLIGDNGADTLFGGGGNDILKGNQGFDRLIGGQGYDSLYGGRGKDVLHGGDGHDYIDGGSSDDILRGGDGNDEIYGGDGADMVSGGAGNDIVHGLDGDDVLFGGEGNDTLYGGDGDDQLTGGSGADVFSYDLIVDQDEDIEAIEANDTGIDTIHDFAIGEDKIAFDGNPLVQGENEAGPQLVAGDLTFDDIFLSQEDSVAVIQAGETTIRLENVHADELSEDDFLFT